MAQTVTITTHYSPRPWHELGNTEHEGSASAAEYVLPEGYTLDASTGRTVIRDSAGVECDILNSRSGLPRLASLAGSIAHTPVLTLAK